MGTIYFAATSFKGDVAFFYLKYIDETQRLARVETLVRIKTLPQTPITPKTAGHQCSVQERFHFLPVRQNESLDIMYCIHSTHKRKLILSHWLR